MSNGNAVHYISIMKNLYQTIVKHILKWLADELPAQLSELGLRPRSMQKPAYTLRKLSASDKEITLAFLRRFFFRDEPMNRAVELLETPDARCPELEDYASSSLSDGVSIAAFDDLGEMVGVVINGIVKREEADYTDKSEECSNLKFRRIIKVLGHLDREARIWDKVAKHCNKVVEIRIASTHSEWRGRGLMRVLCEETERVARAIGATAMRMDTTSAFSAAAAERLHFRSVYAVLYADLPDAPQPEAPHLETRVYIKDL
ncbi:arylalkylamine N-acetyltransferase 1-like isoform X2 [Choristoneura fumiferana]|uniref:arylalkylamine N-acetyltransferase 1-like isoform X2 n=1 Tax=Choristoneura fumiferana TaxID=7141 RepID=UPI003D158ED9